MVDGKKMMNICILEILKKYTDADHTLNQKDIVKKLEEDYDMKVDRKSVKTNLMSLVEFGYDIEYTENVRIGKNGEEDVVTSNWYYNHEFDDAELRMLIDSILFSHSIPQGQAGQLIDKITHLSNVYFTAKVQHVCNLPGLSHTDNRQTMFNIEIIDEAISTKKKLAFVYNTYGVDKKLHPRREEKYIVNPYQMVASNGRYYLVCNYDKYEDVANYRIDKMTDIEILDMPIKEIKKLPGMENGLNLPKHMAEHIYMFSDEPETIILKVKKNNMGDIVDWFDKNFDVLSDGYVKNNFPEHYSEDDGDKAFIKVTCSHQAMLHWAMQYGTSVEVISPQSLREEIRTAISDILDKYNS